MEFLHDGMTPDEAEEETYIAKLLVDQAPMSDNELAFGPGTVTATVVNKTQRHWTILSRCGAEAEHAHDDVAAQGQHGNEAPDDDPFDFALYEPPQTILNGVTSIFDIPLKLTKYGSEMKASQFLLLPEAAFLNTASYGATPHVVVRAAEFYEDARGVDPVGWQAFLASRYDAVCDRLAQFVGGWSGRHVALMTNCNEATSTILKSLPWQVGSRLLVLSCDYEATHLATQWLASKKGVLIDTVPIALPASDEDILNCLDAHLQLSRRIGTTPILANFCHVTSKTGYIFPVTAMTALCHRYGVAVMIDGAQAPGHFPIDVAAINAEFYFGTCHKWMFSCPGVAFLVTARRAQALIQPLAPLGLSRGGYYESFKSVACSPSSSTPSLWLSLWQSFEFVERVCGGWAEVYSHNNKLAQKAVTLLRDMWALHEEGLAVTCLQDSQVYGTGPSATKPSTAATEQFRGLLGLETRPQAACCVPIVPLPQSRGCSAGDAVKLMGYLLTKYNVTAFLLSTEFPTVTGEKVTMLAVRLTLQVHTSIDDVFHLGRAVRDLNGSYGALSVFKEYLPQVT